jgi:hypothetical protein
MMLTGKLRLGKDVLFGKALKKNIGEITVILSI